MIGERIALALPTKGRLREPTWELLRKAGFPVQKERTARSYPRRLEGLPDLRILSARADSIPAMLATGDAHAGITGTDLVHETLRETRSSLLEPPLPLGYGKAELCVAVPECWIDVETLKDLEDLTYGFPRNHGRALRVATPFPWLAHEFLKRSGSCPYHVLRSYGPTEAAPMAGYADAIVDLVATGETLRANFLKRIPGAVLLETQACLWVSKVAPWSESSRETLETLRREIAEVCKEKLEPA